MRLPVILSVYIGKQFLQSIALVLSILIALVLVLDTVELIRRAASKDVAFTVIIEMVFLKLPYVIEQFIPFAILLGGILTFARLTRSQELIVARASGVSAWQFIIPALLISMALGVFTTTIFNPLSATIYGRYETIENKHLRKGDYKLLSISSYGLWLQQREGAKKQRVVIHAKRLDQQSTALHDVTFYMFGDQNHFMRRLDAEKVQLNEGYWSLFNVIDTAPEKVAKKYMNHTIPTTIKINQLKESFASPETISFWELPGFIDTLQQTGFSALKHQLHLQGLLVSPILISAMVLIAAAFSLRPSRQGGVGWMITGGIFSGFIIYYFAGLISALGESGSIPVILAAWIPALVSLMAGTVVLLHHEDG